MLVAEAVDLGSAHDAHGRGPGRARPPTRVRRSSRPSPVVPPNVYAFGLLAPGVGWVANGVGFYMTHDGGRTWGALSLDTDNGNRYGHVAVPASDSAATSGQALGPRCHRRLPTLVLAFDDGKAFRACHTTPSVGGGAVTISSDCGRTWQYPIMPGCVLPESLSFITAMIGFARFQTPGPSLALQDDGRRSRLATSRQPADQRPDRFHKGPQDGWLLGKDLYHTTDGGRSMEAGQHLSRHT